MKTTSTLPLAITLGDVVLCSVDVDVHVVVATSTQQREEQESSDRAQVDVLIDEQRMIRDVVKVLDNLVAGLAADVATSGSHRTPAD